jgi:L-ribulose-5-phosphate 3-epimerase UlaE
MNRRGIGMKRWLNGTPSAGEEPEVMDSDGHISASERNETQQEYQARLHMDRHQRIDNISVLRKRETNCSTISELHLWAHRRWRRGWREHADEHRLTQTMVDSALLARNGAMWPFR